MIEPRLLQWKDETLFKVNHFYVQAGLCWHNCRDCRVEVHKIYTQLCIVSTQLCWAWARGLQSFLRQFEFPMSQSWISLLPSCWHSWPAADPHCPMQIVSECKLYISNANWYTIADTVTQRENSTELSPPIDSMLATIKKFSIVNCDPNLSFKSILFLNSLERTNDTKWEEPSLILSVQVKSIKWAADLQVEVLRQFLLLASLSSFYSRY